MTTSVHHVTYGRPATLALAEAVAAAQADDALAAITVIVPSNFTGLAARRLLGSGVVRPTGLANVQFATPLRLAQLLSADLDLSRRHLSSAVVGAAVRSALAHDPAHLARVADHPVTEAALVAAFTELSRVDDAGLAAIERHGGEHGAGLVRLHRRIGASLGAFRTETDLALGAARRPDLARAVAGLGHVIWYTPAPLDRPLTRLVGAVLAAAPATAIVALTGDADADERVLEVCRGAGIEVEAPPAVEPVTADRVLTATDPDDEVRAVVRRLVALAHDGVRLDRTAVLYPTPDPYQSILEQQLAAAGLPANGPSPTRLADSVAGRTLLAALALPDRQYPRDLVLALASGAPIRHDGGWARPSAWETLSREAGVVGGLADWRAKLRHHTEGLTRRRAERDDEVQRARIDRDLAEVASLGAFVDALAARIDAVRTAPAWPTKADAARALLIALLGATNRHASWPAVETDAFDRVDDALTRLAALDEIEPSPDQAVFRRALATELDVTRGRSGRFGEGVLYGPLSAAPGLDLDAVFIVGANEGNLPMPRRDDAMIPNRLRELTAGQLTPTTAALADQHRALLAALAAAPAGRRHLSRPRGELRSSRRTTASRWLVDTVRVRSGRPVAASEVDGPAMAGVDGFEAIASHRSGVLLDEPVADEAERELRVARAVLDRGGDLASHWVAAGVARGLVAQAARRSTAFTEWDGNLAGQHIPLSQGSISASRLETWATCGFRYLLAYELGLGDRDDPERIVSISPLDKGTAVHAVLERFVGGAIATGRVPAPGEPWPEDQRAELRRFADEAFDELRRRGRTGRDLFWRQTRADLLRVIDRFVEDDEAWRADQGCGPTDVEWRFGIAGAPPLTLELGDGRSLAFRGLVDRVDRRADGSAAVSDYKTGKAETYLGLLADDADPVLGGTALQLGIYAEAVRQHLAPGGAVPHTSYWRLEATRGDTHTGYAWTEPRRTRLLEVLTAIVDGIAAGVFPAVPGAYDSWRRTNDNCTYCDFDGVCPRDRGEHAEAKAPVTEATQRRALAWEPTS